MVILTRARQKTTTFKLYAPEARRVTVAGSFNGWNADALSAKKDSRGTWSLKINLKPGRYEYRFVVDGSWVNDPNCTACVPNEFGSCNCTIDIK
ncbi:MAG: isoamylase early set domain-containing protein [Candidatus Omnitrophica bacterium]|nr:isoamylase early set domain-containing protein [Candidatus Omnitrophota bacterium]